jgi:hypothetical protein
MKCPMCGNIDPTKMRPEIEEIYVPKEPRARDRWPGKRRTGNETCLNCGHVWNPTVAGAA